ncbi:bifunctional [glutamine synthetase] adenylyltransferase/[glutamine synthetase]-adenylyl-L-tyrosine phosphorylase [Hyphomicrobium sp. D-2]|uniref:bifunctional [glutamine synthetase] adenylyltransferase/[glutamine synthetase]-adenylyl-L-tyrosine phosphorylase n=1 Tax=Hyphomicrobium sp. D-2 TaxID=3041621 RepID=UPI002456B46D|nr:bifunctional [glutamine synthetase] adenylyltransferase/[glutamine synthetase]-adenylyl-L-tyrosine phosphorylase [Hyphomicrobium sp. D-2]MDH4981324.1 bifunctional [glutamine synthetase] adenylyltransferase/[glutamine synthetase]-adenylyl-L-tyrosine phosphorylase [Hyphomicrobium sp. D-2]
MADQQTPDHAPLMARLKVAPVAGDEMRAADAMAVLKQHAEQAGVLPSMQDALRAAGAEALLAGIFAGSPYLTALIDRDPTRLVRLLSTAPEQRMAELRSELHAATDAAGDRAAVLKALRVYKNEVALLTALADLGGVWNVTEVTGALTRCADATLASAVSWLFREAAKRGQWLLNADGSIAPDGYIVLATGKYGASKLNYSSDIDLIVFYDPDRAHLAPGVEAPGFFVRLTRDLVQLMSERTGDGYVFRTDLRLRPDAGATQLALSTGAALIYYESFGQNWERAALIKARACAADVAAGEAVLQELAPFVWRKYLDYAAIADVHAMKRQIFAHRGFGQIAVAGHNVKLGRGGIREIEFFVQTQQLIAGGRQPDLRARRTLDAMQRLVERGWIKPVVAEELTEAYEFLRGVEHRLQMVADEQTHEIPDDPQRLERFAKFCGYADTAAFSKALIQRLETVQSHYAALFEDAPQLTPGAVNMVFAGENDDPGTVVALKAMGFSQPSDVLATIRGWHHGRYAAVRSARARERLTEVQPLLVEALADTVDPDRALMSFDRFLAALPAGVQLFSLLRANPALLRLLADIMGTAPRLAGILSRRPRLLDAVLDPGTLGALPSSDDLDRLIAAELGSGEHDMQHVLDRARVIGNEQQFLIGVRVLSGAIKANQAGGAYALLAERMIAALKRAVDRELVRVHGRVEGGGAAVLAMGKLGGREMTAGSDLDLIVIYDFDPECIQSDGERPLAPGQYYARLTQRLITALSSATAEGTLYEVDMRLRPSGQQGPVATQLRTFVAYQRNEAWTWEHMALTRGRAIAGPQALCAAVEAAVQASLVWPRNVEKIAGDVREMRERIFKEKGSSDIWELKQVRGGLVDVEFIAQYLQLVYAAEHPEVLNQNTIGAYRKLRDAGLLRAEHADVLIPATRLLHDLTQILRLCLDGRFDPATAPRGLKKLLAVAGEAPTFEELEFRLRENQARVAELFDELVQYRP